MAANTHKLLPARFDVSLDVIAPLKISVLSFPFAREFKEFQKDLNAAIAPKKEYLPYRQLNNAFLACVPTLTHGFEYGLFGNSSGALHI